MTIVECQIAIVGDGKLAQHVEIPAIGRVVGLQGRRLADRTRAQTGAGTVGYGLIKGHAGHGDVHAAQVFGIAPPQKGRGPAKGVLEARPF